METQLAREVLSDGFERVRETVRDVVSGSPPERLLWQPPGGGNPIAWLVWHLSRVNDDHVAGIANVLDGADPPRPGEWDAPPGQVWHAGWAERFGLPYDDGTFGFGQSLEEVSAFPAVDPALLAGYHAAVHERTLALLGRLDGGDYTAICDERWDPHVTIAVRLASVLNDTTQHAGQASYVMGLAERCGA